MNKFINWINKYISPVAAKMNENAYLTSMQGAFQQALPAILVGAFAGLTATIKTFWSPFPDLSIINTFTFGLISIYLAYIIPYGVLEMKGFSRQKVVTGFAGISVFIALTNPTIANGTFSIPNGYFGTGGMTVAIVSSLFVSFIFSHFYKLNIFGKNKHLPPNVITWFETLIPYFVVVGIACLINATDFNVFTALETAMQPIASIGNSLIGFVLFYFVLAFFYALGLSAWTIYPIFLMVALPNTQANIDLVAAGQAAIFITTFEVMWAAFCQPGGMGCTLPLNFMMMRSKSKRIKAIGNASIATSIVQVNEPLMYGLPVVLNPIMMIPFYILSIMIPALTYITLSTGIVPIPGISFMTSQVPYFGGAFIVTEGSITALLLCASILIISYLVYYPFFKVYEKQVLAKEAIEIEDEDDE